MKRILIFTIAFVLFAQFANAQDCLELFPHKQGTMITTTSYNAKGKETGKSVQTILEKASDRVKVRVESYQPKVDTATYSSEYELVCKDGKIYLDMESYLDGAQLAAYEGMEVEVDANEIEMPQNATAGQVLNDGSVTASVTNQGMNIVSITVDISDRRVESVESLTTPAGTYKCAKITYTVLTKMGFIKIQRTAAEWYSQEIGVVRTESYDKKGKLDSYTELTSVK